MELLGLSVGDVARETAPGALLGSPLCEAGRARGIPSGSNFRVISHPVIEPRPGARLDRYQTSQSGIREGETVAPHDTANPVPDATVKPDTPERRLLARMPLHAITVRARRGRPAGAAADRDRAVPRPGPRPHLGRAGAGWAGCTRPTGGSASRTRHPLRVAIRILSATTGSPTPTWPAPRCCTTPSRTTPRLAPGTREAALAVLAGQFGERTAAVVAAVTNPGWETGRDEARAVPRARHRPAWGLARGHR